MGEVNPVELKRLFDAGQRDVEQGRHKANPFWSDLKSWLKTGETTPEKWSIRELFEAFVPGGAAIAESWAPGKDLASQVAPDASDISAFVSLIAVVADCAAAVMAAGDGFELSRQVQTVHTDYGSGVGWATTKRGLLAPLTRQMIYSNDCSQFWIGVKAVTDALLESKEKRLWAEYLAVPEGTEYKYVTLAMRANADKAVHDLKYIENWPLTVSCCSHHRVDDRNESVVDDSVIVLKISERGVATRKTVFTPEEIEAAVHRSLAGMSSEGGAA